MPAGIRWRKSSPTKASHRWTYVHVTDHGANPDAVVTVDGTDPRYSVVIANDAARALLDTEDGTMLTRIVTVYSDARDEPQTLTLAKGNWKLAALQADANAAMYGVLDGRDIDLTALQARAVAMRERIDRIESTLRQ